MTSTEAMIYQLKKLKGKPLKQKIEHILTYFRLPIVMFLVFIVAIGSFIFHLATEKDTALNVTCINAYVYRENAESIVEEFAHKAEIDLNKYNVYIGTDSILSGTDPSTDYYTIQAIAAQISAHDIDLLVADMETATDYFYQEVFWNLRQLLTPQQMIQYAENLLYVDMALVRLMSEENVESIQYPDPTKPEKMEEPVPVALLLSGNSDFVAEYYPHNRNNVAIGFVITSENMKNAQAFLEYVMQ